MSLLVVIGVLSESEPIHGPTYDRETAGVVTDVEDSSDEDNQQYAVTAMFTDDQGHARVVRSHMDRAPDEQDHVSVTFEHAHPDHAVIVGGRTHPNSWVSPVIVMAIAGVWLVFAVHGTKDKRMELRLLSLGIVADGKVVERREEGSGDGTTWTTRFELETLDKRTSSCNVVTDSKPLYAVGESWPILYDPGWPDHAIPLSRLGGSPMIGADDRITYRGSMLEIAFIVTTLAMCAVLAVVASIAFVRWC